MTGFDVGGRLPIYGRAGELTPGAIILLIVLLAIAAAIVVINIRARMNGARHLELTVKARVAEKREARGGMGDCHVTFELAEGETRQLRLTGAQASLLAAGDTGRLTYRGKEFVSFDKGDGV